jgi:Protein of unknown function (DUF4240)
MTLDQFWNIVEEVHRESGGDMDAKCELLDKRLRQLPLEEVLSFGEHFAECQNRAYNWELWAAAYIICHGCSDDSFSDFRSTLISMGREVFDKALADPQSLADMHYDAEQANYEGYQYVAHTVYEELSGGEEIYISVPHPEEPSGQNWDESKVGALFPKLAEAYDYRD